MRHRTKRRLSLAILLLALPVYIVLASSLMTFLALPQWAEMLCYTALGLAWALPFKGVFLGVGQAAPDEQDET